MSYNNNNNGGNGYGGYSGGGGGGGYGGRGRGRRDDRPYGRGRGGGSRDGGRQPMPESSSARFRKMVIKLGDEEDFEPLDDPGRLAKVLRRGWREGCQGVLDGFRVGITQEPYKHSYYVSLLVCLSRRFPNPDSESLGEKRKAEDEEDVECGTEVLEDLSKGFKSWVEAREWQNARLCLQFFSKLAPAGLVSPLSLIEVYKSLLGVLNEVGGGGDRAERAIRAVGEGLMMSGSTLHVAHPEEVESIIGSIEMSILGRRGHRILLSPFSPINGESEHPDTLNQLLTALNHLRSDGFNTSVYEGIELREGEIQSEPYSLESVSMPPEMYDEGENAEAGEGRTGAIKFFADEIVPSPDTVNGWLLRSLLLDTINIFEINRKECARILLSLPTFLPDMFKTSSNDVTTSLESAIVSTLLGTMFHLPTSPHPLIYYGSVLTELCKLSPNTVAPPVGRAVRKLFGMLGTEGLDVEISRRASEWFAIHLSNFGFQWMWKEWIPELELPPSHPKRAFMRRTVELEIRLAYHDRIMQTLPEVMLSKDVISEDPPEPFWPYENHPLYAEAVELLKLYRQKASSTEIITHLDTLPNARSGPDEPISDAVRVMASETLLQLGSRSFSHFLNATERYLDVLRHLTPNMASRRILLDGVASYYKQSSQMRLVVVDKYLQYGVLEGVDVVDWIFQDDGREGGVDGWTDGENWELLRMTLDKVVGRVAGVRRRLRAVEREDENVRARRVAKRLESGDAIGEGDEDEEMETSREAQQAQTSLDIQSTKLEKVFESTTKHFIATLLPWCFDPNPTRQGLKAVLQLLDSGEEGLWSIRARFGWWREFVRLYLSHLSPLAPLVERTVMVQLPAKSDETLEGRAENMVKGVWLAAIGQEE